MKYFIFTFFIVTKLIAQEYSIDSMVNKNLSNEYKLLKKEVHFDTDRHLSLGKSFYDKKDFINAEKIFLAILEKGDKTKYEYITAEKHLGDIYKLTKKYNKALIHYNNIKDKIKKDDLVYILNSLGYTYVKIYDSEKALEVLSLAKQINEESGNIFDKGGTLGLIAWVYSFDENEKEQSLKYHKETLEAFIKIGEPRGILTSSANLASTYTIYGKYDKALEYLSKALIIAIDLKDVHSQGMIILNFSEVYFNLHKYEEGLQKVNEAFILFEKINSKHGIGLANYFYGILYLKINNYQKAENHLKESLKNCIEDSNLEYIKKNYYYLYELNLNRNDSSKALDHYKNYIVIKDSINKIKHGKVNQQLKLNLGFKEIEKELINSKSELKILNQNNDISRFKVIILSISIILFLIVSFFIFINIKNRNKTLKLNNEKLNYESQLNELIKKEKDLKLVYQSKEIRDFAFNISDKIKILETFKNKLQKVSKKIKDLELKKELTTLIISINQNIEVNKEKVVLNAKTTNYKEDFLFNLKNKYPDLSKKEVQVSVYLAMNFSSKEIALQLGVTSRTVDNYRVAVRAKLGLNKKQNLEEFLANFI